MLNQLAMRLGHITPVAAAPEPRSGFGVRPRRGELPALVMCFEAHKSNTKTNIIAATTKNI